jgi:hypothetical protein
LSEDVSVDDLAYTERVRQTKRNAEGSKRLTIYLRPIGGLKP